MKKFIVIVLAIVALAACSKESRSYKYNIHIGNLGSSYFVEDLLVNEYNADGVRLNAYGISNIREGDVYERKSAQGADRITIRIESRSPSSTAYYWVSNVFTLPASKDIVIDGSTIISQYEPAVR